MVLLQQKGQIICIALLIVFAVKYKHFNTLNNMQTLNGDMAKCYLEQQIEQGMYDFDEESNILFAVKHPKVDTCTDGCVNCPIKDICYP